MIFGKAKLLALSLFLVTGLAACTLIYSFGSDRGAAKVQAKWDKATKLHEEAIKKLKSEFSAKETAHEAKTKEVESELLQANARHEADSRNAAMRFVDRLRKSEERSRIYQHQAERGPAQCQSLAAHAGQLDKSLEEGRGVVQELRLALGQCLGNTSTLIKQIDADRKLFE